MKNKIKKTIEKINTKFKNNRSNDEFITLNEEIMENKKFLNIPNGKRLLIKATSIFSF